MKNASQLPLGAYPRNLVRHDFIVAVFYTLNGILGTNYDWINISLYFAGVIFALFVENDVYRNGKAEKLILSSAILLLLTAAFFTFTEYPPQLGIFQ